MIQTKLSDIMGSKRTKIPRVSEETGISRTTLTAIYYGESKAISFDVLEKLCVHFDCTPGDLLKIEVK